MIRGIPAKEVPQIWNKVEPYIKRALDRGSVWTLGDIYEGLECHKLQLWTWWDQEITTVLITTIYDRTCLLLVFSGDNLDSLKCYNLVEEWALSEDCDRMLIHGRIGWSKVLGFTVQGRDDLGLYVMEKRLRTIDGQRTKNQQQSNTDYECAGFSSART